MKNADLRFFECTLTCCPATYWSCLAQEAFREHARLSWASHRVQNLYNASFADVLNETTGLGYQRRFNVRHSLDFRRYIQHSDGTSTPLVFNLRPSRSQEWSLREDENGQAGLYVPRVGKALSQVDCQHRLGHLSDLNIELPFMAYVGLSEHEELELFNTINSKAKGLSGSLIQFHEATLAKDAAGLRPELFIVLQLINETTSPWYRRIDLGGKNTSGLKRRASLATMQKAVRKFLTRSGILEEHTLAEAAATVENFWRAVALVLPKQWADPRSHVLTKGVGVYALMETAADIYRERGRAALSAAHFSEALSDFALDFDWTSQGPLQGFGGQAGATHAAACIREFRQKPRLVAHG